MDSTRRGGGGGGGGSSTAAISTMLLPAPSSAPSSVPSGTLVAASAARTLPIEEHFDRIRANLIRCEECNENFFFDFLRHPRYFVAHFKACHLKNVLYRFNGLSEEENQRIRFGPRRKKDASAWFSQLKSTEKRMISMQDNKWSEIAEKECWVCRACNDQKADLTHAYEPNDLGQRQALLHLRQMHVTAYDAFLRSLPEAPMSVGGAAAVSELASSVLVRGVAKRPALPVPSSAISCVNSVSTSETTMVSSEALIVTPRSASMDSRANGTRSSEAERSRLRRLRAPPEAREMEAQRSKKRREKMTPAQRHVDYERRKRKKKRMEEAERSKKRRKEAPRELKEKETRRSRDRRLQATEEQREREAQRSRERRRKATEDQKARERERCRRRYEAKKLSILQRRSISVTNDTADDGDVSGYERGGLPGEEARSGHRSQVAGTSHSVSSIPTPGLLVVGGSANGAASVNSTLQSLYASLSEPPAAPTAGSEPQS